MAKLIQIDLGCGADDRPFLVGLSDDGRVFRLDHLWDATALWEEVTSDLPAKPPPHDDVPF